MTAQELGSITASSGLPLTDEQLTLLTRYAELLSEKNSVVNLISRKDEKNIFARHILHSLTLLMPSIAQAEIPMNASVFDLGTGGGLPGIPVKIARPDIRIVCVDSIGKKIAAVNEFIASLSLGTAEAITARAEELGSRREHRRAYDAIITRAVAPLDELVTWTQGLIKPGAVLLALKGGDVEAEIKSTKRFRHVAGVSESLLALEGYDSLARDEKKVVRVTFAP